MNIDVLQLDLTGQCETFSKRKQLPVYTILCNTRWWNTGPGVIWIKHEEWVAKGKEKPFLQLEGSPISEWGKRDLYWLTEGSVSLQSNPRSKNLTTTYNWEKIDKIISNKSSDESMCYLQESEIGQISHVTLWVGCHTAAIHVHPDSLEINQEL